MHKLGGGGVGRILEATACLGLGAALVFATALVGCGGSVEGKEHKELKRKDGFPAVNIVGTAPGTVRVGMHSGVGQPFNVAANGGGTDATAATDENGNVGISVDGTSDTTSLKITWLETGLVKTVPLQKN